MIRNGWEAAAAPDCFEKLFMGIEACQLGLRLWSNQTHNNPRKCVKEIKEQLHMFSSGLLTDQTKMECEMLRTELEHLFG